MQNRWNSTTAPTTDALDEIVHVSRLLGSDPGLVLHGGGNTSIKSQATDVTGETVDVLYVKGSGWDLVSIERAGFAPLRRARLAQLLAVEKLTDTQMMNELRQSSLDSSAPDPSVESLLHAMLPARVVLHSHADALVAVMNQPDGRESIEQIYGDRLIVIPYVMPGFDLARLVAELWPKLSTPETEGMVLMNHGLFTLGETGEEAYSRHIEFIQMAEERAGFVAHEAPDAATQYTDAAGDPLERARFRADASRIAGRPLIVRESGSARAREFAASPTVSVRATHGPATPDHVIRTKRLPLIGRDLAGYASAYTSYFVECSPRRDAALTQLDAVPRVVLDPEWGLVTVGGSAAETSIAEDIYLHTMDIVDAAERQSGYQALPSGDIFDVEYWELEQAKLRRGASTKRFQGEIALVTGAASGIGRACAQVLLDQGAAVIGLDLSEGVTDTFSAPGWLGVQADVADLEQLRSAIEQGVRRFGGIDIVVPAAGIFTKSALLADMDDAGWLRSLSVNTTAVARLFSLVHPYLKLAPKGGRVVLIATKNIAAPGPGASSYSASKAAAAQVARVAALEWAPDGIRVNLVHPDAVFDTGLWTPELLAERARKYGVTEDEYKRRNLLSLEITSLDVGRAVAELCSDNFRATTGANLPVDGGNERVI
ncbi:bifunctional aldolase/short-chain dehydrogenase [Glaciibacter psychrotolerans]|uniref:Rhamnose utilization protein RhaD (Predicted bifunctional aldolase and dehydrogenase)/NAD(P)-dependent dehydrogenase (Short-subunit alcohol dehydrogenase family) n=1 Tax=Glaciibacter psychrotolerans TaxID=670054 RepID=A0A7Z0J711_9MICO|nr:bifunctional aldolase/short-chain dehydrogenase [Leifsonia psychrotolerans]NYJ20781.1 rhamnose utilization protein RhaD (predicted bifunctional aldolase and dehydrogenase)/NAD(P)-dependent dehydrogenase (short-subunit alcohol dehydrogenase family) [Leifsonia psychrotolerans]